ncbi:MAG: DUF2238 domain-containing protein [Akkermansiaceae bacterium]|nr:DUF2238 domain-containing protein [Akkermansiaceae bacterium]
MNSRPKFPLPLVIFTLAYIAVASASALGNNNREFVIYILVMVVMIAAIFIVHRRSNLSRGLLWALSVWGLLHMAGGLVPIPASWPYNGPNSVLYSLWLIPDRLKYDQVVHAYGFAITTWLCWEALRAGLEGRLGRTLRPTGGLVVLCAAGGMGFGAFNEIVEFFATLTLPHTNVGDYENTGWDLVFNAIGSTIAAAVIYFRGR